MRDILLGRLLMKQCRENGSLMLTVRKVELLKTWGLYTTSTSLTEKLLNLLLRAGLGESNRLIAIITDTKANNSIQPPKIRYLLNVMLEGFLIVLFDEFITECLE